jgi:hypothetical protein
VSVACAASGESYRAAGTNRAPTFVLRSGATGGDTQPVAVWIYEGGLAAGKPLFIDRDTELLRDAIDILDVEVDRGVRARVAFVFRQVARWANVPE